MYNQTASQTTGETIYHKSGVQNFSVEGIQYTNCLLSTDIFCWQHLAMADNTIMLSNQPTNGVNKQLTDVDNISDIHQQRLKTKCPRLTCTENDGVFGFYELPSAVNIEEMLENTVSVTWPWAMCKTLFPIIFSPFSLYLPTEYNDLITNIIFIDTLYIHTH